MAQYVITLDYKTTLNKVFLKYGNRKQAFWHYSLFNNTEKLLKYDVSMAFPLPSPCVGAHARLVSAGAEGTVHLAGNTCVGRYEEGVFQHSSFCFKFWKVQKKSNNDPSLESRQNNK